MIYLVSSLHRSGSSMTMNCLRESLPIIYDPSFDVNNNTLINYIPNPDGFFQFPGIITEENYSKFDNKLIKYDAHKILDLPKGNYKLLFLKRKPEDIRKSMLSWTPFHDWGRNMTITFFYEEYLKHLFDRIKERKDIDLIILNYEDIIKNPKKEFKKLLGKKWKIDIAKCISKVKPELHRNQ